MHRLRFLPGEMSHEVFGDVMKRFDAALRSTRLFRKYFFSFVNIVLASFLFLGFTMLLVTVGAWAKDRLQMLSENARRTAALVGSVYHQAGDAALNSDQRAMVSSLLVSYSETLEADFFLCNTHGEVIGCREAISDTAVPALCPIHSAIRFPDVTAAYASHGRYSTVDNPGDIFHQQMLLAFHPLDAGGKSVGFVVAAQPLNKGAIAYMASIFRAFLLSGMIVFLVDFVLVYYISYRLVRPVGEMVEATRRYGKGDFGFRVEVSENDELRLLAESFNSMAVSLASLESSRRSFVANVSHELKTPMTTIGGFIDGMRDGTIPPEDQKKYLGIVSGEVRRLSRLVTGMLNLSRIEAGELELKRTDFDLSELIFSTALSFERMINEKGIALTGLEDMDHLKFYGDKDMLTQVFYNLIDNAVKFTPRGERIALSAERQRGRLLVAVKNTGVGIAPEDITRIFERFYKTDQSRSYDGKSAGLGLYLAMTIVKLHGGSIRAESDGNSFTRLVVELPEEKHE